MANINLNSVYDSKKQEFQTMGTSMTRFDKDFIDSANRSINEINILGDLKTRIARAATRETILTFDEKYEHVLSYGITFHLMLMGRRPAKGDDRIDSIRELFLDAINLMRQDFINIAQEADTDDTDTTTIGIGPLG